jgi:chromosome segregation ATPase
MPIAERLSLEFDEIPAIVAENLRYPDRPNYLASSNLVFVSAFTDEVQLGKDVIYQLFELIKMELDKKIEVEIASIYSQIAEAKSRMQSKYKDIEENDNQIELIKLQIVDKNNEIKVQENEIKKLVNSIQEKDLEIELKKISIAQIDKVVESEKKKISIADERVEEIEQERKEVKQRIDELYEQQKKALSQEKTEGEAISMLLYSNEIQKNLQYYNELGRRVSDKKLEREDRHLIIENNKETQKQIEKEIDQIVVVKNTINADIENINTRISGIKNEIEKIRNNIDAVQILKEKIKFEIDAIESQIALLEGQTDRVSYAQLVKEPQPIQISNNPLMLTVVIVGFISVIMFTFLAFFVDYIARHKRASSHSINSS